MWCDKFHWNLPHHAVHISPRSLKRCKLTNTVMYWPRSSAASCLSRFAVLSTNCPLRFVNSTLSCAISSFWTLSSVVGCPLTITNTHAATQYITTATGYLQLTKYISLDCVPVRQTAVTLCKNYLSFVLTDYNTVAACQCRGQHYADANTCEY